MTRGWLILSDQVVSHLLTVAHFWGPALDASIIFGVYRSFVIVSYTAFLLA